MQELCQGASKGIKGLDFAGGKECKDHPLPKSSQNTEKGTKNYYFESSEHANLWATPIPITILLFIS